VTINWILENPDKFASVVMAVTAVLAWVTAVGAVLVGRKSQREATAKDIYRDYLKLAFQNPEVAEPRKGDALREERYRWFVAFMLTSCDEIVRIRPGKDWRKAIFKDLESHLDYLRSDLFIEDGGWPLYSPELKRIADEAFDMKNSRDEEQES